MLTAPVESKKLDLSEFMVGDMDFNKSASNEIEASLMVWELYAYIKELENKLKMCVEMK